MSDSDDRFVSAANDMRVVPPAATPPAATFRAYDGPAFGYVPCVSCGRKLHHTTATVPNPAALEVLIGAPPQCRACTIATAGVYPTVEPDATPGNAARVRAELLGGDGGLVSYGITRFVLPRDTRIVGHLAVLWVEALGYWSYSVAGQSIDPTTIRRA